MSTPRFIGYIDPFAEKAMQAEARRDVKRTIIRTKRRNLPARPDAWEQRRREYLEEVGRIEKPR